MRLSAGGSEDDLSVSYRRLLEAMVGHSTLFKRDIDIDNQMETLEL